MTFPRIDRSVAWTCLAWLAVLSSVAETNTAGQEPTAPRCIEVAPARGWGLEGYVYDADGNPAAEALVVCSAGGQAVADAAGRYRLALTLPKEATSVQLTAVGQGSANRVASASVALGAARHVRVDPLRLALASSCTPGWQPTFGEHPGTDGSVAVAAQLDDGSGPALYVGGSFTRVPGAEARNIARFDGTSWSALGDGLDGGVYALAVFDDGSGPALYAGGSFTIAGAVHRIARWDGTSWSPIDTMRNGSVFALAVFDDGSGPALYAGGDFIGTSGAPESFLARWDGVDWTPVGTGVNGPVRCLMTHDDGSGPALFAGGSFLHAGGAFVGRIARWNGTSWAGLSGGTNEVVQALAEFDDGSGLALYVGGLFGLAGGAPAEGIARWDGAAWSAVGGGTGNSVEDLEVHDDGSGPALYASGSFTAIGGVPARRVARWDGASWSALGSGVSAAGFQSGVVDLASFDLGKGPVLAAAGNFESVEGHVALDLARWDGSGWSPFADGFPGNAYAMIVHDDGTGPALYVGGQFPGAGGLLENGLLRWDGRHWSSVGGGVNGPVYSLAVFDEGNGPRLFVGGAFQSVGGIGGLGAERIARWDGSQWTRVGSPAQFPFDGTIRCLLVHDDGSGPALFAGGNFTKIGTTLLSSVARWNGALWTPLGSGTNGDVATLVEHDDGTGPALYAGGRFNVAGGVPASRVARWDGSSWSALGSGVTGGLMDPEVKSLVVFDEGAGPMLFAAGSFKRAGGIIVNHVARWNGASWSALAGGVQGDHPELRALCVHDDGSGPALYATGDFTTAGGVAVRGIARWDGLGWSALGSGLAGVGGPMLSDPDVAGPSLYVGGESLFAPDSGDGGLARWACDAPPPPHALAPPAPRRP